MSRIREIRNEILEHLQEIYGCVQAAEIEECSDNGILLTDDNGETIYKIEIREMN